ncbi:MAG: sterol desaturase family protein [Acetobacteraceae bacterium]|nr:sterol desaturase family protein [Acetobacteraceae bacterium]MSP28967.1 sterol desaturase family protein [Acetobacteraceae bacterium]
MIESLDLIAGWLQENLLLPLLYSAGLMVWEELSFGWALFAVYGAVQVALTFAVCVPLERWLPVERWADNKAVWVDVLYTVISRVGVLPLITFVLFWQAQTALNGFLTDHGWVPPTLERIFPSLLGQQILTFILYAIILDAVEYWRHWLSHRYRWWWALHALHHAQRQMTFWSDDRNHLLDDIIAFFWFGVVALLIGVPPMQFPLLVLVLRFLESLSHANTRLSFGTIGERVLISPRFHRRHHGLRAAGRYSCNYGAVLPWWDMIFHTADFSPRYLPTGDPSGDEKLANGGYWQQQRAGLRRLWTALMPRARGV